jgi:hypothetical protein
MTNNDEHELKNDIAYIDSFLEELANEKKMKPNTSNNGEQIKIIKGDLILKKDTIFKTSIKVKGNIQGYYDLKVAGNIDAWNIDARNINAGNINAWNINAWNINAGNINAWNINAGNIICCDKIKVKLKCICKFLIKDRFSISRKEWSV